MRIDIHPVAPGETDQGDAMVLGVVYRHAGLFEAFLYIMNVLSSKAVCTVGKLKIENVKLKSECQKK